MGLRSQRAPLISFSGLDGAGKSTQVEHAAALLEGFGLRVKRLVLWDDVAVLTRYQSL